MSAATALVTIEREFAGMPVKLLERDDGEVLMTAEQIGLCLGYAEGSERKRVLGLVDRHPEVDEFKVVLKLRTTGGTKDVTAFRESALYMLACFAETERAGEFRAWVARTCTDLRTKDKILVSREEWETARDTSIQVLHCYEKQANAMAQIASMAGRVLALRRQTKPKDDPRQLVFASEWYEEVATTVPAVDGGP